MAVTDVERLAIQLEAQTQKFDNALRRADENFARTMRSMDAKQRKLVRDTGNGLDQFGRTIERDLKRALDPAVDRLGPAGALLRQIGPAGIAAGAGLSVLGAALFTATQRVAETERITQRLEAVLKITGHAAGLTGQEISEMAARMERDTGFAKDEILGAAAALATFTAIGGENFERTLKIAQDMTRVFGGDLRQNVDGVARALDDPIRGFEVLRKRGFALSEAEAEVAAQMMRVGDAAGAQAVVLRNLEAQVGGAAGAEQKGLTGAFNAARLAMNGFLDDMAARSGVPGVMEEALRALAFGLDLVTSLPTGASGTARISVLRKEIASLDEQIDRLSQRRPLFGDGPGVNPGYIQKLRDQRAAALKEIASIEAEAERTAAARQGEVAAKAEAATTRITERTKELAAAIEGFESPAERLKRFRDELEQTRREMKASLEFGADPAAVEAGIRTAEELFDRRAAAIRKTMEAEDARLDQYERAKRQAEEQIRSFDAEVEMLGHSAEARAARLKQVELENAALRAGIAITAEVRAEIEALAAAHAAAAQQPELGRIFEGMDQAVRDAEEARQTIGMTSAEIEVWRFRQRALNEALALTGELSAETLARIDEATEIYRGAVNRNEELTKSHERQVAVQDRVRQGMIDIGLAATRGAGDFSDALGNMARRVADLILELYVLKPLMESVFGAQGTSGGGMGLGSIIGGLFAGAGGGAGGGVMPAFAKGGIATKPSIFGEAGPEAAVPLPDGRRIPVDLRMPPVQPAAGGGVRVQIVNNTPAEIETRSSRGPDGREMVQFVINEVKRDMASGGFDASFGTRFGVRPQRVRR